METIAVLNEKGGVGKTSLVVNLAYLMAAEFERQVVAVDLDQQANMSSILVPDVDRDPSVAEVFRTRSFTLDRCLSDAVVDAVPVPGLQVAHSNIRLAQALREIPVRTNREKLLQRALDVVKTDYVFIDCPPAADDAVLNAIYAASIVLVPVQMGGFAANAIQDVLDLITDVKGYETPADMLSNERVVFVRNMLDKRVPSLNQKVNAALAPIEPFLAKTTCRVASAVSHATIAGKPLLAEQPDAPVLDDYRDLIKELLL